MTGRNRTEAPGRFRPGACCFSSGKGKRVRSYLTPYKRILVKGNAVVTEEAAKVYVENNLLLYGNESQTVGPEDAPMSVHLIMLGAQIVLLEGIRLQDVEEGIYLLNAAPINLGGSDGAPCRAILLKL